MQRQEVRVWVLENTDLTPWELEDAGKSSTPRWWKFLNYVTVDAARSGFMEKEEGLWTITEEGVQAVESMDPPDLYQAARDGYREWQAEQENDDDDDDPSDSSDRSGVRWTPPFILPAGLKPPCTFSRPADGCGSVPSASTRTHPGRCLRGIG